jgi:Sulfotransferase family
MHIGFGASADPMLQSAYRSYSDEHETTRAVDLDKVELARGYDVPGMNRAVTICHWGRSGSLLLSSYLDNHSHIVMLPYSASESIYNFFEEYESLSVWEKLIAYPAYSALKKKTEGDFFLKNNPSGDFAIEPADYYDAVHALFEVYGNESSIWLDARRRFFQLVHAAYGVAIGRRPADPRPLMVHAQHYMDERLAARLIEDFPGAQFIHTIRDPITSIDSWFGRKLEMELYGCDNRLERMPRHLDIAVATMIDLLAWDKPHRGTESRTRAIRFEDMHVAPEATMRRLADWLGVPYQPCLVDSTWNGIPYVVQVRGVPSCGANPANAKRRSKNLDLADRMLIFALLHANFVEWNYASPRAMRNRLIRLCVIVLLWLVPTKMEFVTARLVLIKQALPSLSNGRTRFALSAPIFLLTRRFRMMWLVAQETRRRLSGRNVVIKPI